jgi:hypothetical protein
MRIGQKKTIYFLGDPASQQLQAEEPANQHTVKKLVATSLL